MQPLTDYELRTCGEYARERLFPNAGPVSLALYNLLIALSRLDTSPPDPLLIVIGRAAVSDYGGYLHEYIRAGAGHA